MPLAKVSPALLSLALAGCAARPAVTAPVEPISLTLVATNDLHGWVQPHKGKVEGREVQWGGLATFAGYLATLRAENPGGVVVLDAGDLFQGTLVANLSEGAVVIDAYNALGFDAAAIGNHEFDYGPVGPKSAAVDASDDPLGALEARAAQAKFPLLARNVYLAADGRRAQFFGNDGTAMLARRGVKIGLVGLVTPMTPQVTNPVNVLGLRFGNLADEARTAADELRRKGAEVLVALVHAGGTCKDLKDPLDLSGCDPTGEVFEMLRALPAGLFDVVISAHTHTRLGHVVNGMPVLQSASYGTQFGVAQLLVDARTHKVLAGQTKLKSSIPICLKVFPGTEDCDPKRARPGELAPATFHGAPVVPDPKIAAVIEPYLDRVLAEQRRSLKVAVPEALTRNQQGESPLGDALAEAVREMEKTDVSLLNSGGLRADLPAGELTFGQLYEVMPFDNTISTLSLTGDEIVGVLEALLSSGHGAPQIAGVRLKVRKCADGARVTDIAFADGRKFDRAARYKLTTSDFLALGGDGTGKVLEKIPADRKDYGHQRSHNMRDALAGFLEQRGGRLAAKVDGRLAIETSGCP